MLSGFRPLADTLIELGEAELAPLREGALEAHPWKEWATLAGEGAQRMPGAPSRWNNKKDLSWEPVRLERVVEVSYDHLQGPRFRHATRFLRWRPDRTAAAGEASAPESR